MFYNLYNAKKNRLCIDYSNFFIIIFVAKLSQQTKSLEKICSTFRLLKNAKKIHLGEETGDVLFLLYHALQDCEST